MEPIVMRVSYSILSAWARGDHERALAMYFREPMAPTPAMIEGTQYHEAWERSIVETKAMPAVFGARPLDKFEVEARTKREIMLTDWLQLVGVLDLLRDKRIGTDWKTGRTKATTYANGYQHKVYQILYPLLNRFEYYCFNQHTPIKDEAVTMSIIHLSDKTLEDGVNWVMTVAGDMRAYLENNGMWRQVGTRSEEELLQLDEIDNEVNLEEEN